MPSMRRIKVFTLLIFLSVITLLFYTASYRQSRASDTRTMGDFYDKTVNALNTADQPKNQVPLSPNSNENNNKGKSEEDDMIAKKMAESLKEAAQVAKDNANAKAPKPDPPSLVVGKGSAAEGAEKSVAGRKKFGGEGDGQKVVKEEEEETKEDHDVEVELNLILKKSPSKFSFFPFL